MYKYKGQNIKDIVNVIEWQKLRKSFLGTWKNNTEGNIKKLEDFLGNIETADERRLVIVLNYLTGSLFRTKKVQHKKIDILISKIKEELKGRNLN